LTKETYVYILAGMTQPKIPDAEMDLLAALNRLGPSTARELREALAAQRPMAHGSVVTLLGRLHAKSLVTRRKAPTGKAFVYSATRSGSGAARPLLRQLVDRLFGGSRVELVAMLLDSQKPTAAELEDMQKLLDTLKAKG